MASSVDLQQLRIQFSSSDPATVLNVAEDITIKEATAAFRKLALLVHPDKVPEDQAEECTKLFQLLLDAYNKFVYAALINDHEETPTQRILRHRQDLAEARAQALHSNRVAELSSRKSKSFVSANEMKEARNEAVKAQETIKKWKVKKHLKSSTSKVGADSKKKLTASDETEIRDSPWNSTWWSGAASTNETLETTRSVVPPARATFADEDKETRGNISSLNAEIPDWDDPEYDSKIATLTKQYDTVEQITAPKKESKHRAIEDWAEERATNVNKKRADRREFLEAEVALCSKTALTKPKSGTAGAEQSQESEWRTRKALLSGKGGRYGCVAQSFLSKRQEYAHKWHHQFLAHSGTDDIDPASMNLEWKEWSDSFAEESFDSQLRSEQVELAYGNSIEDIDDALEGLSI